MNIDKRNKQVMDKYNLILDYIDFLGFRKQEIIPYDDIKQIAILCVLKLYDKYETVDNALMRHAIRQTIIEEIRKYKKYRNNDFRYITYANIDNEYSQYESMINDIDINKILNKIDDENAKLLDKFYLQEIDRDKLKKEYGFKTWGKLNYRVRKALKNCREVLK